MTMSAGAVRALLERHGLEPRRSMGQNFMVDHNTIERIAAVSHVGPGTLLLIAPFPRTIAAASMPGRHD